MRCFCFRLGVLYTAAGLVGICQSHLALGQAASYTFYANLYDNASFVQTSDAAPTTPSGYFFSVGASSENGGIFNSASVAYPGPGSPMDLPATPGTAGTSNANFGFSTPPYASLSDLHSDFPFGQYTITGDGPSGDATAVINYPADYFASTAPYLTNFDQLNGMNPSMALTVNFPAFTPDPNATEGFTFFTVTDGSGNVVTTDGFLDPSTTSVVIPANALMPNTTYSFELDYSDRVDGEDSVNQQFTEMGFDLRDDGTFTTGALPAPAAGAQVIGLGLLAVLFSRRKRTTLLS